MRSKAPYLLLALASYGLTAGCALQVPLTLAGALLGTIKVPTATILVDSNACREELGLAVTDISVKHVDLSVIVDKKAIAGAFTSDISLMAEFSQFSVVLAGTRLSYLIQRQDDSCHIRLYRRVGGGKVEITNTITFIDSAPVPNCTCNLSSGGVGI